MIQVCDSILNIGPCANASMGEPAFLSEEVNSVVPTLCFFSHQVIFLNIVFTISDLHLTHSSKTILSQTWKLWCALVTVKMVHCPSSR